jgi:amidase
MSAIDIHWMSLQEVGSRIARRELSPVEVTRATLARIDALDPVLGAYAHVSHDAALAAAAEAEREIMAGMHRGPLHGVPVAVKDLLLTKDVPTGFGTTAYEHPPQSNEATAVARLRAAGAIIVGKLTMTECAMLSHHEDLITPVNPWGADFWTGASSSGSGVAVAAGLCFAALGSDTAGSIRNPAACCGITGLKPTWGRISRHGVLPLAESLDHIGPMARSSLDAAIVLGAIAGPDPADPSALRAPVPDYVAAVDMDLRGIRIGVDRARAFKDVDAEIVSAIERAMAILGELGAEVRECAMPDCEDVLREGQVILGAEAAEFHGRLYDQRPDACTPTIAATVTHGRALSAAQLLRAQRACAAFANRLADSFEDVDLMILPVLPAKVPTLKELSTFSLTDSVEVLARFNTPINVTGRPSLALPCGVDQRGMPIGLQIVGRPLEEDRLLAFGHAFQKSTQWHVRHPVAAE